MRAYVIGVFVASGLITGFAGCAPAAGLGSAKPMSGSIIFCPLSWAHSLARQPSSRGGSTSGARLPAAGLAVGNCPASSVQGQLLDLLIRHRFSRVGIRGCRLGADCSPKRLRYPTHAMRNEMVSIRAEKWQSWWCPAWISFCFGMLSLSAPSGF